MLGPLQGYPWPGYSSVSQPGAASSAPRGLAEAPADPARKDAPAPKPSGAAGAPALGGVEPEADQPAPQRVRASGETTETADQPGGKPSPAQDPAGATTATLGLTQAEQQQVAQMQQRDREVRNHEQAHVAAGGSVVTGGASFSYQTGPDGRRYATGGEVPIDASEVPDDPEATVQKARQIRRAALAPAQPSAQDRAVAASASQMETEARREIIEQKRQAAEEAVLAEAQPGQAGQTGGGSLLDQTPPDQPSKTPPLWARLNPLEKVV